MKLVELFAVIPLAVAVCAGGCTGQPSPGPVTPQPLVIPRSSQISNPKMAMSSAYTLSSISLSPGSLKYTLPLDLQQVSNFSRIQSEFKLNAGQEAVLRGNGFVVIPWTGDDIVQPYKAFKTREIPIFVTTDTLLHLYHIQFNEVLKRVEEEEFYSQLISLSRAMLERAESDYGAFTEPELKEAARRNAAYFLVALKLLETPSNKIDVDIPRYAKKEVSQELSNVEARQGFTPSAIFNSPGSKNPYEEDYSQYVPRGHYTRSETLKSYFKAMMWYGRMAFLLKGGSDGLIAEEDARLATIQASLIAAELPGVKAGQNAASEIWNRIYSVTSFFVGVADDLTPYEYLAALEKVFGTEFAASELADEDKMLKLKAELAGMRNPEIYGGSGVCVIYPPVTRERLYECLSRTKGLRFMGQRFVPDSYMFQNLVSPAMGMYTGNSQPFTMKMTPLGPARTFPRGLDIMAVMGSDRAYEILKREGDTEYRGEKTSYDGQLAQLKKTFAGFSPQDWQRNLYWAWLYALKPLLEKHGEGYPTFMQTDAWKDKELNTALASWTELRHDTILYAKQSYTPRLSMAPPPPRPLTGYIEPVPEFYARMLSLTRMTRDGLSRLGVLNQQEDGRLRSLEDILSRAQGIAAKELENKELAQDEYDFIRDFGEKLESIVSGVEAEGKETTLVAEVHTDTNLPEEVLEEAVGYVNVALVAYKVPDGRIIIGAGPALSYYEFKQPINSRLTNEQWKQMLKSGQAPSLPKWTGSFYQP